ncbi:ABC transporter permease [Staphylococcus condimenti]|nr:MULTISPECIES: ABC transporter permease [Staphylococcus]APR61748.1 ABC transporter permease [Staphylococcus condimenti]MDK8644603.1 ABC transporter permease [Staphylococcus condimenti]OFP02683.1 ABC transporter permease [Staphylococcus sp. HMSC065E08]
MTFKHIVLKNLKQNLRHYGLYLFSLIFSIALYFSFVTLKYTKSINNEASAKIIRESAEVGSIFLFTIIVIFLMYVNQLFIKQRVNELGLYQLIGLTRTNIIRMLMLEQFVIFIMTGIVGIIGGLLGSRFLLLILVKLMKIKESIHLIFSFKAFIATILMLLLAYVLIIIQNSIFIKRRSILKLMKTRQATDVKNNKITKLERIFGVVGVIMIAAGYVLALDIKLYAIIIVPLLVLFLTIVGAYFFFRSTVSLLFKTLKNRKNGNVNINDVIFTSSIMHRMKKNALSLTIIAVISAITVTVLCFSAITLKSENDQINSTAPYDATIQKQQKAEQYRTLLDQHNIQYHENYKQLLDLPRIKNNIYKGKYSSLMGIQITSEKYVEGAHITRGKGELVQPYGTGLSVEGINEHTFAQFDDKNHHPLVRIKVQPSDLDIKFALVTLRGGPLLILNQEDYKLIKEKATYDKDNLVNQYGFTFKEKNQEVEATKLLHQVSSNYATQKEIAEQYRSFSSVFLFVSSFLGIAFLIAAGCIIYIKQMDETEDEMENFKILRKLGFTHEDMRKGLMLKVVFNFGLPLVVGLLHAYFASWAFLKLMVSSDHSPVILVMVLYTIIYACFAMIAYNHMKRKIRQSI